MKKLSFLLAMIFTVLLMLSAAQADTLTDLLQGYGLTGPDAEAFAAVVKEAGVDLTDAQLQALLGEVLGSDAAEKQPGILEDGFYSHPLGFSMRVPEGWTLIEDVPGATVILTGPVSEKGFAPSIGVLALSEERGDFATLAQEDWDTLYEKSLTDYQFIAFDAFDFLESPAHEFVCMHGENEASMFQYQMYFNKEGKAFIITLTTLAEEAEHEVALETYDKFLGEFEVLSGEGIG